MNRRISPALARKIDRLSRRAHRFHAWAHHPLCTAYQGELLRLGRRTRVCRGCVATIAGAALGALAALCMPGGRAAIAVLAASLGWLAFTTARSTVLRAKLLTRFLPSAGIGFGLSSSILGGFWPAAIAGVAAAAGAVLLYRRRGPDRSPCRTCPERAQIGACSGYAPIVRRERAFRRLAVSFIASRDGQHPHLDPGFSVGDHTELFRRPP